MKLYDPDRLCPKCGWKAVGSRYCTMPYSRGWTLHDITPEGNHIHRDCGRCGAEWVERALDQPEKTPEELAVRWEELRVECEEVGERLIAALCKS